MHLHAPCACVLVCLPLLACPYLCARVYVRPLCACVYVRREWGRLDYYRVDKFYSLIRCFFRSVLNI
jgi:Nucleolar protein,Nop52